MYQIFKSIRFVNFNLQNVLNLSSLDEDFAGIV